MKSSFFAFLGRMKFIERWQLMRNTSNENLMQHSCEVAQIAYCLAEIENKIYKNNVNSYKVACRALFHEISEVITGDMPTPIKYYNNEILSSYKQIEKVAENMLYNKLPSELQDSFKQLTEYNENEKYEEKIVKTADKLSAYIKCIEEKRAGNKDFILAEKNIYNSLTKEECELQSLNYFIKTFIKSYSLTLDELNK